MKKQMTYLHMTTSYGYTYAIHRPRLDFGGGYEITVTAKGTPVDHFYGGTLEESIAAVVDRIKQAQNIYAVQGRDADGNFQEVSHAN